MEKDVHLMFSMSFLEFFRIKICAKTNSLSPYFKERHFLRPRHRRTQSWEPRYRIFFSQDSHKCIDLHFQYSVLISVLIICPLFLKNFTFRAIVKTMVITNNKMKPQICFSVFYLWLQLRSEKQQCNTLRVLCEAGATFIGS